MSQELKVLSIIGIITLIILASGVYLLSKGSTSSPSASPTPVDARLLIRSDSHQTASDSAKVTIVEFGDYQCPACGEAYPILKQVLKDFDGKINFVFRNFPLTQHQNAMIAAEVAEAAGAQGKFWQMHDRLYETQDKWSDPLGKLSQQALQDIFKGYAQDLGLDIGKFQSDISTNKFADKISQDMADANGLGINVTPTFFINGVKAEGVLSYDGFKSKIEANLNSK